MNYRTKQRLIGAAVGAVVPLIFFILSYQLRYGDDFTPQQYLQFLVGRESLSKVASLCVLPNLAAFYVAIRFDRDSVAHGVLFATIVWALLVAVLYFAF